MIRTYTPRAAVRFATSGSAAFKSMAQTVEPLLEAPSDRVFVRQDFTGVVRRSFRDFRRYLLPEAVAQPFFPNNGGMGPNTSPRSLYVGPPPGFFYAVGDSFGASSADGISWTNYAMPAFAWRSVVYVKSLDRLVAVGPATINVYSDDHGLTWNQVSNPTSANGVIYWKVIWTGTRFVAAGYVPGSPVAATMQTSDDGITWVARSLSTATRAQGLAMNSNASVLVVGTDTRPTQRSTNGGLTWSPGADRASEFYNTPIAYGNGIFLSSPRAGAPLQTSPDGLSWASGASSPAEPSSDGIMHDGTVFHCVGGSKHFSTADGTSVSSQTLTGAQAIAFNGKLYVVVCGAGGTLAYSSTDATAWTPRTIPQNVPYYSVVWAQP